MIEDVLFFQGLPALFAAVFAVLGVITAKQAGRDPVQWGWVLLCVGMASFNGWRALMGLGL